VDVVFDIVGHIVVHDRFDILDIQTTGGDVGGDEDGLATFTELAEEDVVWQEAFRATEGKGENSEMIQARADEFVATLRSAPEEKVAIVSHSGLLTAILYGAGNDGVGGSLKHCDPYVIQR